MVGATSFELPEELSELMYGNPETKVLGFGSQLPDAIGDGVFDIIERSEEIPHISTG